MLLLPLPRLFRTKKRRTMMKNPSNLDFQKCPVPLTLITWTDSLTKSLRKQNSKKARRIKIKSSKPLIPKNLKMTLLSWMKRMNGPPSINTITIYSKRNKKCFVKKPSNRRKGCALSWTVRSTRNKIFKKWKNISQRVTPRMLNYRWKCMMNAKKKNSRRPAD